MFAFTSIITASTQLLHRARTQTIRMLQLARDRRCLWMLRILAASRTTLERASKRRTFMNSKLFKRNKCNSSSRHRRMGTTCRGSTGISSASGQLRIYRISQEMPWMEWTSEIRTRTNHILSWYWRTSLIKMPRCPEAPPIFVTPRCLAPKQKD